MKPKLRNENSKVSWNVVLNSPHALAYRLWIKEHDGEWQIIAEGGLADEKVDAGEFIAVKGTQFAYWLGIASDKPKSNFKISIVLGQDNIIVIDGILEEKGRVNDEGIATRLETVTFE